MVNVSGTKKHMFESKILKICIMQKVFFLFYTSKASKMYQ